MLHACHSKVCYLGFVPVFTSNACFGARYLLPAECVLGTRARMRAATSITPLPSQLPSCVVYDGSPISPPQKETAVWLAASLCIFFTRIFGVHQHVAWCQRCGRHKRAGGKHELLDEGSFSYISKNPSMSSIGLTSCQIDAWLLLDAFCTASAIFA